MTEHQTIYKTTVDTMLGQFLVVVYSTSYDAKSDIYNAIQSEFNLPWGSFKIKNEIEKSNRTITKNMQGFKNARLTDNQFWAWGKKI